MLSDPPLHPPPLPRLLEVYEVAYLMKCSQEHVRRQIREGKLKARRLGTRSWRIDPEDYKAFIDGQVVAPAPDPDGSA
jgi:excisionase family DNA binding protein